MENSVNTQATNNETQENNKIIAEFMGVKPRLISPDVYGYSDSPFFSCIHDTPEKVIESISKYAKYHSDWNWLMPVIAKCRIESNEEDSYWEAIYYSLADLDIDNVYTAVVSFIEWYNANK